MSRFKEKVTRENNAADFVTKFVLNSHQSHIVIISITRNKFILLFNCEDKEITTPLLVRLPSQIFYFRKSSNIT